MGSEDRIHALTASQLADAIASRKAAASNVIEALRARIDRLDKTIHAWTSIDWNEALSTARQRDAEAEGGTLRGPLHGVPIGIKDIYDAAGMVTTFGAADFAHSRPHTDAAAVARLREAGAIILGKTATTEFAFLDPAETRNPWNLAHTPGGSSSGSAAAVALSMVPLAVGSQTLGSVLRPAAYCGVVGFKPTYGRISLHGVLPVAPSFDHAGTFSRTVEDAALAFQILAGSDGGDIDFPSLSGRDYLDAVRGTPHASILGIPRRFFFDEASQEVTAHVDGVANTLAQKGVHVEDVHLPSSFDRIHEAGLRILRAEAAAYHRTQFASHRDNYRPKIRELIDQGLLMPAVDYVTAQQDRARFGEDTASLFAKYDALLMPVTPAPAPRGHHSTGDPRFCAPWTFIGVPAISLPSGMASNGLPLAIQLVAGRWREGPLLAVAAWVESVLGIELRPPEN